jgi:hypothetical protein
MEGRNTSRIEKGLRQSGALKIAPLNKYQKAISRNPVSFKQVN